MYQEAFSKLTVAGLVAEWTGRPTGRVEGSELYFLALATELSSREAPGAHALLELLPAAEDREELLLSVIPYSELDLTQKVTILRERLSSSQTRSKRAALEGLGFLKDYSASGIAKVWLNDDDWLLRAEAVRYLSSGPDALDPHELLSLLSDRSPRVRSTVIDILDELSSERLTDQLITAIWHYITDTDRVVRAAARWLIKHHVFDFTDSEMPIQSIYDVPQSFWRAIRASLACDNSDLARITDGLLDANANVRLSTIDSLATPNLKVFHQCFAANHTLFMAVSRDPDPAVAAEMEFVHHEARSIGLGVN